MYRFLQRDFLMELFSTMRKKLQKIDESHLEILGAIYCFFLFLPILYLNLRDGVGSSFFPMFDQLDETILNYVFSKLWIFKKNPEEKKDVQ